MNADHQFFISFSRLSSFSGFGTSNRYKEVAQNKPLQFFVDVGRGRDALQRIDHALSLQSLISGTLSSRAALIDLSCNHER
jgi:hypothetical protein